MQAGAGILVDEIASRVGALLQSRWLFYVGAPA